MQRKRLHEKVLWILERACNENKKDKSLTKDNHESYEKAKMCYICEEKFENKYLKDKTYVKVRDHDHYTGEYRGAAIVYVI